MLKLDPVGGKNITLSSFGGHKIKCHIFLGIRDNRLHFCKMSLASGGHCSPRPPAIFMLYLYGRHFLFVVISHPHHL